LVDPCQAGLPNTALNYMKNTDFGGIELVTTLGAWHGYSFGGWTDFVVISSLKVN
jgi:hypothetical protein